MIARIVACLRRLMQPVDASAARRARLDRKADIERAARGRL